MHPASHTIKNTSVVVQSDISTSSNCCCRFRMRYKPKSMCCTCFLCQSHNLCTFKQMHNQLNLHLLSANRQLLRGKRRIQSQLPRGQIASLNCEYNKVLDHNNLKIYTLMPSISKNKGLTLG